MASAEKMGPGKWRGVYRDANGKKCHTKAPYYRTKNEARNAANEEEVKARRRAAPRNGALPATTTWDQWWDLLSTTRTFEVTDTGRVEASMVKAHIRPRWAGVALNQISRPKVQAWIDNLESRKPPLSANYIRRIYTTFAATINLAVTEEILIASPCVRITLPRVPKQPKPYATDGHLATLKTQLHQRLQDAVDFGFETGLRPGELAGLHVHRVDVEAKLLVVAEVYVGGQHLIRPFPKDKDSRTVPLSEKAVAIVRRCLASRTLDGGCGIPHADGRPCSSALVFLAPRGGVIRPRTFSDHLRRASTAAKMPRRTPYTLRRGYATRLAESGVNAFEIARVMGHGSLDQSQEYVQETPAARARVLRALGDPPTLTAVEGGAGTGTDPGTHLDSQTLPGTPSRTEENVG
ncbi:site-specific integrase [Longimycelium tulufanense]|nr:tyrosine-type recombinase/integrase [Longimycelium tulufanense]